MSIEIHEITKSFGDFRALKEVSFKVETGELVALLGPSGSVHAELSHGRYSALGLKREDEVFVRPREKRIFMQQ
jgi:sulfate transport system ATP-binding protein